jgi:hypothetical protein
MDKIDRADIRLEEEASKAKSSVGGWFGSKK